MIKERPTENEIIRRLAYFDNHEAERGSACRRASGSTHASLGAWSPVDEKFQRILGLNE